MKLSTKGRYGLRAMLDLAICSSGDQISLYSIAQRQNISENYLEQVFSTLRKAGLVKSIKGAQGGYVLAEAASSIGVGTILRALEGDLSIAEEETDGKLPENPVLQCIKINVWDRMNESLNQVVDDITLESLVNEYRKLTSQETVMYYI